MRYIIWLLVCMLLFNTSLISQNNTSYGTNAGNAGLRNSSFGYAAGASITGMENLFVGYDAGRYSTTEDFNAFIGAYCGYLNTTGYLNTYIGYSNTR